MKEGEKDRKTDRGERVWRGRKGKKESERETDREREIERERKRETILNHKLVIHCTVTLLVCQSRTSVLSVVHKFGKMSLY